jgi:hypothetical protein
MTKKIKIQKMAAAEIQTAVLEDKRLACQATGPRCRPEKISILA